MLQRIKELREARARAHEEASGILTKAGNEKRELTVAEREKVDALHAAIATDKTEVDRLERQLENDRELNESTGRLAKNQRSSGDEGDEDPAAKSTPFDVFVREGVSGLTPEQRQALKFTRKGNQQAIEISAAMLARAKGGLVNEQALRDGNRGEVRAQSALTDAGGAYTIPEGFYNQLIEAQKQFGAVSNSRAFKFTTASGNDLPIPTVNGADDTGELISENTEVDELDEVFSVVILKGYKFTSKLVRVPYELLQDSAFDIASWLGSRLGTRLQRAKESYLTTGTGSSQPNGVVTAATAGKTAASATAVTYVELLDLKHSVDPAYRIGAQWMFKDATLLAIKKLLDSQNRPLWAPGISVGAPDTLDGDPFVINQNMASMATGQKSILYGDFSTYWIRNVGGMRLLRLAERFAEMDQVGFVAFERMDANLIDAGTHPIKYLIQA